MKHIFIDSNFARGVLLTSALAVSTPSIALEATKPDLNGTITATASIIPRDKQDYSCQITGTPTFDFGDVRGGSGERELKGELSVECDKSGVDFVIEFPASPTAIGYNGAFYGVVGEAGKYAIMFTVPSSVFKTGELNWLTPYNGGVDNPGSSISDYLWQGGTERGYAVGYTDGSWTMTHIKGRSPSTSFKIPVTGIITVADYNFESEIVTSITTPVILRTKYRY